MNANEFNDIIEQLRQRIDDVEARGDEDLSDLMRSVRADLRRWDKAGRQEQLPHAQQLLGWGIPIVNHVAPAADAAGPAAETLDGDGSRFETPDEPEAERTATGVSDGDHGTAAAAVAEPTLPPDGDGYDPDDELQDDYDAAQRSLDSRRYRAALNAFDVLRRQASGRLEAPSERGYEMAAAGLAEQLRAPIGRAQSHARKQPQDVRGQRKLWQAVLEIDPEDDTALAALRALDERQEQADVRRQIDSLRQSMVVALERKNYPGLVELLGQAEALAETNGDADVAQELDGLVAEAKRRRDELRAQLGMPSTIAGADDYVATYRLARKYIDEGVPVLFDERGAFGPVGAEYDPVEFFKLARENLLRWSRDKALERRKTAAQEAPTAPRRALQTLQEGVAFLELEEFTSEDRATLQDTLDELNKDIAEVQTRLTRFETAEQRITEADLAPPRERLRLLREARGFYPDYPNLTALMARAEEAVAVVVANVLADRLAHAQGLLDQREFQAALDTLAAARSAAYNEVPHPAPD